MKRKIILLLLLLFLFSTSGAVVAMLYITNTTSEMSSLITLHQIEDLRQHLISSIQTVQSDLYTVHTMLAHKIDIIAENVYKLSDAAATCSNCHHEEQIAKQIREVQNGVVTYQNVLSYYITASANRKWIDRLKLDAAAAGNDILVKTENMSIQASEKLEATTRAAMRKIKYARFILFLTIGVTLVFGTVVTAYIVRSITRPIETLVEATRAITSGDLDHRIILDDKTEFGELAAHFNNMSSALQENYNTLSQEIRERRQVEEALRESEQRFRELADTLPQTVFETDLQGVFLYVNRTGLETFQYAADEVIQTMDMLQMIIPDERDRARKTLEARFHGQHAPQEYTAVRKDGSTFPVIIHALPMVRDGKTVGLRGIVVDITDRKWLETEMLKAQKLESIGILAGGIAHDFNNILTGILGNVSLIKRHLKPEDPLYPRIDSAERASLHARALTRQLLTFARGGAPVKKTVALGPVIVDSVGLSLRGTNVSVRFEIAKDLLPVEADEGQIRQVFNNLVINACQAMPKGGTIAVSAENGASENNAVGDLPPGRTVLVKISDEGAGIPPEHLQKIFDPYFTTKQSGSGLGLAVAYSVMKNHGGRIDVSSDLRSGTVFTILFPASGKEAVAPTAPVQAVIQGGGRVLVMDDEEVVRTTVADMLTDLGYEVMLVRDGREAIERYREAMGTDRAFAAVIMDLTIPAGMGGKDAIRELLAIDPEVRAIVSSGYSNDPVMADHQAYGFRGIVAKPFEVQELSSTLHAVINGAPA